MKEKRKGQPDNLKHYWLIFGLLAIVLLMIPFRLVGYWMLTNFIYAMISVVIIIVLVRFIWRYGWKRWTAVPILLCMILPVFQLSQNTWDYENCVYDMSSNGIFQKAGCTHLCNSYSNYVVLKDTPIGIQTSTFTLFIYCIF